MYCVYRHVFPNEKIYIGITMQKPENRWRQGKGYRNNQYMYRAIKKYKWENIKHEVLYENLTKEQAEQKEIQLISQFKSNNAKYGYNIEYGGCHNGKTSEKTRKLISLHHKKTNLGKHLSDETKEKIRRAHIGMKLSQKTKNKISELKKGNIPYNKGIKKTKDEKYKDIFYQKTRKEIICVELNKIFPSIRNASKMLNIPKSSISKVLKGEYEQTHNLRFRYTKGGE